MYFDWGEVAHLPFAAGRGVRNSETTNYGCIAALLYIKATKA